MLVVQIHTLVRQIMSLHLVIQIMILNIHAC